MNGTYLYDGCISKARSCGIVLRDNYILASTATCTFLKFFATLANQESRYLKSLAKWASL